MATPLKALHSSQNFTVEGGGDPPMEENGVGHLANLSVAIASHGTIYQKKFCFASQLTNVNLHAAVPTITHRHRSPQHEYRCSVARSLLNPNKP